MSVKIQVSGGKAWKKALKPYVDGGNTSVAVGILEGATYSGETENIGLPVAAVAAAHEFGTEHIPARSFMRSTLAKRGNDWVKVVAAHLRANPGKIHEALALVGEASSKDIQAAIKEGIAPALAYETIMAKTRRKGAKGRPALPLVDTGTMQEAISYEVKS